MEVQERRFANYLAPQFKGVHLLTETDFRVQKMKLRLLQTNLIMLKRIMLNKKIVTVITMWSFPLLLSL